MKHISFPSIEKFSNMVANINRQYNFVGLDENGEAIYDHSKPKPIISLTGTIKLHGTNAAFCFNDQDGLWVQSRTNIITPMSETYYEIEFEDGTKAIYYSNSIINGKLINEFNEGDVIIL